MSTIEIKQHEPGKDLGVFVGFAHGLFAKDPSWIAPLNMEVKERLTPKKNPFFEHAEAALFTAWRDGKVVGRCTAQVDHEHLRVHQDDTGFFGFFDTINDQEVATALLEEAAKWLLARGMKTMRGPFSLSINEPCGTLVEGFEHPPVLMTEHSASYQGALVEGAGLQPVKDLLCWHYKVEPPPPRAQKAWDEINGLPEVRFRSIDKKNLGEEMKIVVDIFNDAWRNNWGFVPSTQAEIDKTAKDMKLLIDEQLGFFAEIDGRPVAMCLCLPNVNEAIADIGGKLSPLAVAKLLWRLKVRGLKSARLIALGIRTELRGKKRYGALSTAMYAELARRGIEGGYEWAELGWTLEDNRLINLGIRGMRGKIYKRYRVYERSIA